MLVHFPGSAGQHRFCSSDKQPGKVALFRECYSPWSVDESWTEARSQLFSLEAEALVMLMRVRLDSLLTAEAALSCVANRLQHWLRMLTKWF